ETGPVQEIIEGNAMTIEQADVMPQICFRERCRQIAGTAAADTIVGELAVNFIHRVRGERRNQFRIVVRRQREICRLGCGTNGARRLSWHADQSLTVEMQISVPCRSRRVRREVDISALHIRLREPKNRPFRFSAKLNRIPKKPPNPIIMNLQPFHFSGCKETNRYPPGPGISHHPAGT
ncbi:MAG: hypothetical protein WBB70_00835, partial [Desulfobacterales bacterium]